MRRRTVPALWIVAGASLWMATAANLPLWREAAALGLLHRPGGWLLAIGCTGLIAALLVALLSVLSWRGVLRPAVALLLVMAAAGAYFSQAYGVVIDSGMLVNVLQTDWHEGAALASPKFFGAMALLAGLPLVLLARVQPPRLDWRRAAARNAASAVAALVAAALFAVLCFQPLSSAMRNHKRLRYLVNPLNTVYAIGQLAAQPLQKPRLPPEQVGLDATLPSAGGRPPLLVVVLGETGRAGNFGLNGYARDTTPELAREGVASFRDAWSCGTSTAASVPCMFSPLGREGFRSAARDTETLVDVLQHAGLAVLWLDNQSGCKGVCDRVPNANVSASKHPALCTAGECLDGILLEGLDARLAALPAERRARGVVLVLHQMGSHGPAYWQRSPPRFKRFAPECRSVNLQDCTRQALVNAYDNSIAYTDHVLASAIRWVKGRGDYAGGLLYVADHGESLGENNLFLHGLPYAIAPDVQKHVPWITWLSPALQQRLGVSLECVKAHAGDRLTHDHFFHSVLGLVQVQTAAYRPQLDAYAACAVPGDAPDLIAARAMRVRPGG